MPEDTKKGMDLKKINGLKINGALENDLQKHQAGSVGISRKTRRVEIGMKHLWALLSIDCLLQRTGNGAARCRLAGR